MLVEYCRKMKEFVIGGPKNRMPGHAKKVFEGEIFTVWQWQQELYDGSFATFEQIERTDSVHAVGVLPNGNIFMTKDEQPHRESILTPAGGRLEKGEEPDRGLKREFLEETGYTIGNLVPWHVYRPSEKMNWAVHAYVARDLEKVAEPDLDAGEKVTLVEFSFGEFLALGPGQQLRDIEIRNILLEALLDKRKKDELYSLLYD